VKDELPAPLRTVGATRSVFEREFELSQEDPFAGLGDPDEGGVISGDVLGAGGMGVVHAGIQTALQRQVAVKRTLHREAGAGDEAFLAFLREAWISAKLEHPNIIPVHALCSDRGDPQLVMKRVEGVAWRALLDDDALASEHGMRDRLAFHLAILGRVCRAVHFAHSRGIVHLDLKPDNVMVGRHGEVYLLDWGVAASFHEDADPWVPRTVDIRTVMGTPAYLSPEQAAALGGLIGPRTDVFLLGALIHRIVMGRPPHRGETMDVVMASAYLWNPPEYGDEVPAELAAVIQKAMARAPDERYGSAEEVRVALAGFLQHRDSSAILDAALARLERLRASLSGEGETRMLDPGIAQRIENECRFGIEEALHTWPDSRRAKAALTDLARLVVERALRAGDWRAAAATMTRLSGGDDALWQRIRALRNEAKDRERERQVLQDLGSNQDILRNARVRAPLAAGISAGWVIWFSAVAWAVRSGQLVLSHSLLALNSAVTLTLYAGVLWKVRDTLLATQIDRRAVLLLAASLGGVTVLWTLCWVMGIAPLHAITLSSGVYMFFFVAVTMAMERRLAWVTVALAPLSLISFFDPAHTLEWQGSAVFLGGTALSLIWRRDARLAAEREAQQSASSLTSR
jgi:serine/threonine protein kinase